MWIWLILAGAVSGIVAGMGMGGGTLLIPILSIFFATFSQIEAQGINLLAFIPMAIPALIIHAKNSLIDGKIALPIIAVGVVSSVGGALLANHFSNQLLRTLFGVFLLLIGMWQIISIIIKLKVKNKK